MRDLRDPDPRQLLPMPLRALVAALGLELEDADLLAPLVPDDLGAHSDLRQALAVEDGVRRAQEHGLQCDGRAGLVGQALDEERLPLLDAVLLPAGLDDCVVHESFLGVLRPGVGRGPRTAPSASAAAAPSA